jgi:hypothetical protein
MAAVAVATWAACGPVALPVVRSAAWAQQPAGGPGPAPSVHPGTKLNFPPTLGGAKLEQSTYSPAVPDSRDASYTWVYSVGRMQIYVDVFDAGRRVPTGTSSPLIASQFNASMGDSERQLKAGGFARFERQTVASTCTYGSVSFRCIVYSAVNGTSRIYSKMLLTGYRDSFVKIAVNWSQANGQTLADADKALNEFVPALLH